MYLSRSVPTALSLLYLSDKYQLPDLKPPVLEYISQHVSADNVLQTLHTVILHNPDLCTDSCTDKDVSCTDNGADLDCFPDTEDLLPSAPPQNDHRY